MARGIADRFLRRGLLRYCALLLVWLSFASAVRADYSTHPRADELLTQLAERHGFSPPELDSVRSALAGAQRLPQLIKAEQTAAERTLTWTRYRPLHVACCSCANTPAG